MTSPERRSWSHEPRRPAQAADEGAAARPLAYRPGRLFQVDDPSPETLAHDPGSAIIPSDSPGG